MAIEIGSAYVSILPSTKGFSKQFNKQVGPQMAIAGKNGSDQYGKGFKGGFLPMAKKVMGPLAIAAGAVIGTGLVKGFVSSASDLEQTLGATEAVWGKHADQMIKQSKTAFKDYGLSEEAYLRQSNLFSSQLSNQGFDTTEVKKYTDELNTMAADMSAVFGGTSEDAAGALNAVLRGEYESIEKYGVSLKKADINARLAAEGKDHLTGAALKEAEAQAALDIVTEQTSKTQGAFAKEQNTWAHQVQVLGAQWENLKATLGSAILPIITKVATVISEKVAPAIAGFIQGIKDGTGWGGKFKDGLVLVKDGFMAAFGYVKDTVIPTLQNAFNWLRENKTMLTNVALALAPLAAGFLAYHGYLKLAQAATLIYNGIMKAWTVLTNGQTIAQKALNLAMKMNPIGLVIAALTALVAGIAIAYNKHEGFRNLVNKVWASIKGAAMAVVNWFKNTAWPWMRDVFTWIGNKATDFYNNQMKPTWDKVKSVINSVISWFRDTAWPILRTVFNWIVDKVKWYFGRVKANFDLVKGAISTVINWFRDVAWPIMRDTFNKLKAKAVWLYENGIKPAWNNIKTAISNGWDGIKTIFDKFRAGISKIKSTFSTVKDAIGRIWEGLVRVVAGPINTVIGFINKAFIGGLNKLFGYIDKIPGISLGWKISEIPTVPIPKMGGGGKTKNGQSIALASGGLLPGYSPGKDDMFFSGDRFNLALAGGEAIMRPEWSRAIGKQGIDSMNAAARTGGVAGVRSMLGFHNGGVLPKTGGNIFESIWEGGKKFLEGTGAFLTNPVKFVTDKVKGLLDGITTDGGMFGHMGFEALKGIGSKLGEGIKSFLGLGDQGAYAPYTGKGMPWRNIWSIIQGLIPGAVMTSNYRGNAITASGYPSYHGLGRAVDFVAPNMGAAWNMLRMTGMPWTELYYTPQGFIRKGRLVNRNQVAGVTKANHYDHVHAAFANGGLMPKLYDKGGAIQPGLSLVANATRKPEQVLTAEQWNDVIEGNGGGDTINIYGVNMDYAGEVASTIRYEQRRTKFGKYNRAR